MAETTDDRFTIDDLSDTEMDCLMGAGFGLARLTEHERGRVLAVLVAMLEPADSPGLAWGRQEFGWDEPAIDRAMGGEA